nr:MAG TPA: hypothetical protein [Bacteriophage sp.]
MEVEGYYISIVPPLFLKTYCLFFNCFSLF